MKSIAAKFQRKFLPSMKHGDYRVMWLGHIIGESSSWALGAAEGWLIYNIAESNPSSWVGAVFFAAMLPWFIVPLVVGILTDRYSRKKILAFAYIVSLGHALALTFLVFTGLINVWVILVLATVNGAARAVHMGAIEALTANLVPEKDIPNAYTFVSAGYYATRLIGPGLIAPIMGVSDIKWVFLACTFFYGWALILVLQIRTFSTGGITSGRNLISDTFEGFRYAYGSKVLRSLIFLVMFHCMLVMSFESVLPAISETQIAAGGKGVAYMHMMVGLGALIVSVFLAPIKNHRLLGNLFLLAAILSSVGNLVLALSPNLNIAIFGSVLIGITHTGFMTVSAIAIQTLAPDRLRGRITSIYLMHAGGMMSFSYLIYGALGDVYSPSNVLLAGVIGFVVINVISLILGTPRKLFMQGVSAFE